MLVAPTVTESRREKPARPDEIKLFQAVSDVAPELWEDFKERPLEEVCSGSGAIYEPGRGFMVSYMGGTYLVNPENHTVTGPPGHRPADFQKALVLVSYLTHAQDLGLSGHQVTARELKGGELFFRGPHALLTEPVTAKFGDNPAAFMGKASSLGFLPAEPPGICSCRGLVLPHLSLGLILHPQDEEFPAELTYTFDSYAHYHMPLDAIWSLVNDLALELSC